MHSDGAWKGAFFLILGDTRVDGKHSRRLGIFCLGQDHLEFIGED